MLMITRAILCIAVDANIVSYHYRSWCEQALVPSDDFTMTVISLKTLTAHAITPVNKMKTLQDVSYLLR